MPNGRGTMITRRSMLAAITAGPLLAACAPATGPTAGTTPLTPRRGGSLTFAHSADAITLDPTNIGDSPGRDFAMTIFEGLTKQDEALQIVPSLATSWETSDLRWTFKLRQGVKFHDGSDFDASAVKFVFDRILGPEQTLRRGVWTALLAGPVDVLDRYTVRFTTKYVDPFFPARLQGGAATSMFSPDAFKKYGKDMARNPVGTGPFRFVEWVKDDHFTVERFDGYWGSPAYLDKVTVRPLPEAETRAVALESGDVQLAIRMNPEQVERLGRNPRLKVVRSETLRHFYPGMNVLKKPFSDLRVRQALNYAIDKESIVKNTLLGLGRVQGGLLPKGSPDYVELPGFGFDPVKARQLLAEAGYPNGFKAVFTGTKGVYLKDFEMQQSLQQMWRAVGVDVTLNTLENAAYLAVARQDPRTSPLEIFFSTFAGNEYENPAEYFLTRFGCDFFRPVGTNSFGSCFPEIDALAKSAQFELDAVKRNASMRRVQEMMSLQAPAIWLFSVAQVTGTSAKLHDPVIRNESLTVGEKTWLEN